MALKIVDVSHRRHIATDGDGSHSNAAQELLKGLSVQPQKGGEIDFSLCRSADGIFGP